jgi:hypothetical protein
MVRYTQKRKLWIDDNDCDYIDHDHDHDHDNSDTEESSISSLLHDERVTHIAPRKARSRRRINSISPSSSSLMCKNMIKQKLVLRQKSYRSAFLKNSDGDVFRDSELASISLNRLSSSSSSSSSSTSSSTSTTALSPSRHSLSPNNIPRSSSSTKHHRNSYTLLSNTTRCSNDRYHHLSPVAERTCELLSQFPSATCPAAQLQMSIENHVMPNLISQIKIQLNGKGKNSDDVDDDDDDDNDINLSELNDQIREGVVNAIKHGKNYETQNDTITDKHQHLLRRLIQGLEKILVRYCTVESAIEAHATMNVTRDTASNNKLQCFTPDGKSYIRRQRKVTPSPTMMNRQGGQEQAIHKLATSSLRMSRSRHVSSLSASFLSTNKNGDLPLSISNNNSVGMLYSSPRTGYQLFCNEWHSERALATTDFGSPQQHLELQLAVNQAWKNLGADEKDHYDDRIQTESCSRRRSTIFNHSNPPASSSTVQSFARSENLRILPSSTTSPLVHRKGKAPTPHVIEDSEGLFGMFNNDKATLNDQRESKLEVDAKISKRKMVCQSFWEILQDSLHFEYNISLYNPTEGNNSQAAQSKYQGNAETFACADLGAIVSPIPNQTNDVQIVSRMLPMIQALSQKTTLGKAGEANAIDDARRLCRVFFASRNDFLCIQIILKHEFPEVYDTVQLASQTTTDTSRSSLQNIKRSERESKPTAVTTIDRCDKRRHLAQRFLLVLKCASPVLVWSLPQSDVGLNEFKSGLLYVLRRNFTLTRTINGTTSCEGKFIAKQHFFLFEICP